MILYYMILCLSIMLSDMCDKVINGEHIVT